MAELNIQAIKDRVARGRLQGGNPTGGDDGPFHLYHLALDDLDALIAYVEDVPPSSSVDELRIQENGFGSVRSFTLPTNDRGEPLSPEHFETFEKEAHRRPDIDEAVEKIFQSPRVADLSDEDRAKLLAVAEEHKE